MRLGRPASNTAGNCHQMQCDCVSDRQSTRRSVPARRDLRLHCIVSTRAAAWPRRLCSACLVVSPVRPRNLLSMPSCSIMPWPHQTLMYEIIGDWPKPEARATCLQACWWLSEAAFQPNGVPDGGGGGGVCACVCVCVMSVLRARRAHATTTATHCGATALQLIDSANPNYLQETALVRNP